MIAACVRRSMSVVQASEMHEFKGTKQRERVFGFHRERKFLMKRSGRLVFWALSGKARDSDCG